MTIGYLKYQCYVACDGANQSSTKSKPIKECFSRPY